MCTEREKNCLCVEFMAAIWWNYRISWFNTVSCMCVLSSLLGALSVANVNANSQWVMTEKYGLRGRKLDNFISFNFHCYAQQFKSEIKCK